MGHSFDMLTFDFLLKPPQPITGLFLMFGRDPRIPLNTLLQPKIRYMGTDENILSLEALQRIYYMVAENLKLPRERQTKQKSATQLN